MKPVFADTSSLIAVGNTRDSFHTQAVRIKNELKQSRRDFVTTDAVLLEFGNAFSAVGLRAAAAKMIEAVRNSKKWRCVSIDGTLMERGLWKFRQVKDKEWGLVDCISIIVSEDIGITEVFTTDHHFEQAGFRILLKKQRL
jgi:predicted nucleic acid-binding protein